MIEQVSCATVEVHKPVEWLTGGGEMGALILAKDWSGTALGAPEEWSPTLRTMVRFLLANRFPLLLWWGPQYISIYNDAYRPVLGTKHPWALGRPVSECWSEIWHVLQPLIDTPFHGGPATWDEDLCVEINRYGFVEETHFTVAYSPVPDDTAPNGIGGVLATVHEITEKVVGERRVVALRDLGAGATRAKTAAEACTIAAHTLANHARDVPFALLYLTDPNGREARLAGASGIAFGGDAIPVVINLAEPTDAIWPLTEVLRKNKIEVVDDLAQRLGGELPPGPWSDPPRTAAVVPIRSNIPHRLAGFLVVGVSSRLKLDELYLSFLELMATQIATAIANARAYEEEKRRAEALAEIDRAKTVFFSNISHEFRTPLTLMMGPIEDALQDTREPLSPAQRERVNTAHRNSIRLLRLVNTLLDFARIEAGRSQARFEPLDLATLTADIASNFTSAFERAGMTLTLACPSLPQPVFVDREMWEKVVLNLLSNAFKFTFQGGATVRLRAHGSCAELSVQDTGVGVPAHELSRVFERFHRIEKQKSRTYEGSGIGLALIQELVRLHGGEIGVESEVGCGTRFTVTLPFGSAHLEPHKIAPVGHAAETISRACAFVQEALGWLPHEESASEPTETCAELAALRRGATRPRVVIADDNADMRDYVARLLSREVEIEAATDGRSALRAIRAQRPDLVLSDVMMPELDGLGLLQEIRSDDELKDLPVILLSARAGEEARVEGVSAGATEYLTKPFSARELVARVRSNIDLARARRAANAALVESEARFRNMAEHAPVMMWVTDSDARCSYLNRAWYEFTGRTREESERFGWLEAAHPDDRSMTEQAFLAANSERKAFRLEYRLRRRDNEYRWIIDAASPRFDAQGAFLGYIGSVIDISERKAAERVMQRANEVLSEHVAREVAARVESEATLRQAQKMEALGQLTGGIAHDFNNMLVAVIGNLDLLQRRLQRGETDVERFISHALAGANRAASLTQRLLTFSRQQAMRPETISINQVVADMSELLHTTLGESVRTETVLASGLWRTYTDASQLESAIVNLAVNARDAMPDGGTLTIETANASLDNEYAAQHAAVPLGQYVMLAVTDTGVGMSPETVARAFDPFFTTKPVGKGTGLGLSQVYGFVHQCKGHVKIFSEPKQGTTVKLYLPRFVGVPGPASAKIKAGGALLAKREATVLLVEDEEFVRSLTHDALKELGYRVLEAENASKALELLDAHPEVDLLFTDIVMPDVNGRKLADEARRRRPGLKVLYTTGYTRNAIVHDGVVDPGVTLLSKPFNVEQLAKKLADVLELDK